MNAAMILAGGTGSRIGADKPKQFLEVMGKPILAYTLEVFQQNSQIDVIEIVCHKNWRKETEEIVKNYGITKTKWIVEGGATFQESVKCGIFSLKGKLAPEDLVVISFGVSPMVTDEIIKDSLLVCQTYGNAIASEDMVLCTCIKDDEISSTQPILRETIKGFASPWTFRFWEVYEAYERAAEDGILEGLEPHTTSLYFALGKRIYFSKSSSFNIKITTKEDMDLFEGCLLLRQKRRKQTEGEGKLW